MYQMGLGICERLFSNIKVTVKCCVVQMGLGICERLFLNQGTDKCGQMGLGICERLFSAKVILDKCWPNGPGYL